MLGTGHLHAGLILKLVLLDIVDVTVTVDLICDLLSSYDVKWILHV